MTTQTLQVGEFREGLAGFLREVKQGAVIVVTEHNRPVARLVPPVSVTRPSVATPVLAKMAD